MRGAYQPEHHFMLDFETTIVRQAEHLRARRNKIARYKAASWRNLVGKLSLLRQAYPVADWPRDELAIIGALIFANGMLGLAIFS